ncbi:MAG: DUF4340 domain-containing protein [Myxococcales bacterium]|nr:DUF4340 domain-containing protein [Myxococcales bacterium]
MDVGRRTRGRAGSYYVRRPGDDEVLLVGTEPMGTFENVSWIRQKVFREGSLSDIQRYVLGKGEKEIRLERVQLGEASTWVPSGETTKSRRPKLERYVMSLESFRPLDVSESEPDPSTLTPLYEATWYGEGDELLGSFEIASVPDPDKARGVSYVARGPYIPRWVPVSITSSERLLDRFDTLLLDDDGEDTASAEENDEIE